MKILSRVVFCSLSSLLLAHTARAAESVDPFELSPEQLFAATVTSATKTSTPIWDVPAAVYVLSNEDITRAGATSIAEALRLVPGVQVARTHAGAWAVSIRGFNAELANKLLVLMDGREVYDGLFSGVYWDVQDTLLEDIDRIEVIRGPGASLWGANAVNGVINIITKRAEDTQGNLASALYGNKEKIGGARHGGKFGENGHYRAYGKYVNRDDHGSVATGSDAADKQIAQRGGFRADWTEEHDSFTVQGDVYESISGQFRTIPTFAGPPFTALAVDNINARGGNILGRMERKRADGSLLTLQSYIDYTARDQQFVDDVRATWDIDAQLELPQNGRHAVIYGGRYRVSYDDLDTTSAQPIINFVDGLRYDQTFSAFVQDKITLVPEDWFLTLGTKVEHNDFTGFEIQPNARLQWHPDKEQMLWASVSRAVRTPSRLEEDIQAIQAIGGGGALSLDTLPNPELNSEDLIAYELGYRRQLSEHADLDIATFYNDYNNLISYSGGPVFVDTDPARVVIGLVPLNHTEAEVTGLETTLNWRVRDDLHLSGSYSLLKLTQHEAPGELVPIPEGASPQQQFNARAQWDVTDNVTFDTIVYYVDQLPAYGIGDYVRLDTRLGWNVTEGLDFNLVGQNLLDHAHREFNSATAVTHTEVERAFYGQFVWRF